MNLDVGRLAAREALSIFGVAVGCLAAAALGGLLAWLSSSVGNGALVVLYCFGSAVLYIGTLFAVIVATLAVRSWDAYERRLSDWHGVTIEAVEESPMETTRTMTEWDLSGDRFLHMLGVVCFIQRQIERSQPTPWSVRSLAGDLWFGGRKLGVLSNHEAERVGKRLEQAGLVVERKSGRAGQWRPSSLMEAVELLEAGWR
jgi:hypothetical protein